MVHFRRYWGVCWTWVLSCGGNLTAKALRSSERKCYSLRSGGSHTIGYRKLAARGEIEGRREREEYIRTTGTVEKNGGKAAEKLQAGASKYSAMENMGKIWDPKTTLVWLNNHRFIAGGVYNPKS